MGRHLPWILLLCFFFCSSSSVQASRQSSGVLLRFSGAGALWTSHFLVFSSRGIGKHFVQSPLHEHWDPGVSRLALLLLFDSMACCCFLLSFLFLSLLFLLLGRLRMMNGNWMDDRNYLNYQYLNICYHSLFHSCELSCLWLWEWCVRWGWGGNGRIIYLLLQSRSYSGLLGSDSVGIDLGGLISTCIGGKGQSWKAPSSLEFQSVVHHQEIEDRLPLIQMLRYPPMTLMGCPLLFAGRWCVVEAWGWSGCRRCNVMQTSFERHRLPPSRLLRGTVIVQGILLTLWG